MADIRVSQLTKAYSLSGNDRIPVSQTSLTDPDVINTLYMAPSALQNFIETDLFPSGLIWAYAGIVSGAITPPSGWLLCDGSELQIDSYKSLYSVITDIYGKTATPTTTFKLPDMRCRFAMGFNNKSDTFLPTFGNFSGSTLTLGQTGGVFNHTLTLPEIPLHNHQASIGPSYITYLTYPAGGGVGQGQTGAAESKFSHVDPVNFSVSLGYVGGDGLHNTTPPYVTMHYIIKT